MRISLSPRQWWTVAALAVIATTFIAFGRSLTQDFAPLDDDLLITHNLAVRGITPAHLRTVFTSFDPELYIPLTFVSYQVNYMLAGLSPWIYHLTNILLHAINAMLVGIVLLQLTGKRGLSFLGALLFAVHPLNTEAVVWLAGRKDLLSTCFTLLSLITYLRYRKTESTRTYAVSIVLFLLALLSKVMAVTLPAILILIDCVMERRPWNRWMMFDKIPYAVFSGIFLGIATLGKERILAHHSVIETLLMAAKSTVFYLEKFLFPIHLGVFHPYRGTISLMLPAFFVPVLIVMGIAAIAVCFWKKHRWIAFGTAFFLISLAPTFINFHKGAEMYFASDRYPYLPQIGLLVIVMMAMDLARSQYRQWAAGGMIAVILLFCGLAMRQSMIWDSADALFRNTLTLYPESVAARTAIASILKEQRRYQDAQEMLRQGLRYGDNATLRMSLGSLYAKVGEVEAAATEFGKAHELEPDNPEPLVGLGVLAEYEKKSAEAMNDYRRAVELDPSYVEARNKLGSMLFERGNVAEAEEQFREAIRWNPNADGVLYNLALVLDAQGKKAEALPLLQNAHELNPDDPTISKALEAHLMDGQVR